jgi:predicted nucleic acid-binding protein
LRPSTLICIDSNQFIFGLNETDEDSVAFLNLLSDFNVAIPRLIVQEVARNLDTAVQVRRFYRLIHGAPNLLVVDDPVPQSLVVKYIELGLREKADAVIGAFAEWVEAKYLVSDNRHFLQELETDAFEVISPTEFLDRFSKGEL